MKFLVLACYASGGLVLGVKVRGNPQWHAGIDPFTVETRPCGSKVHCKHIILSVCKHFYEPGENLFCDTIYCVVDRVACLE